MKYHLMHIRFLHAVAVFSMLLCSACGASQSNSAPAAAVPVVTVPPAATALPQTAAPPPPPQPALLAYVQHGDVWAAELPNVAPQRLSSGGAASTPRWSPSGAWLSFCQDERLYVVRRAGGAAQALGPCNGRWLPARDELAFVGEQSTTIVDVASGQRRAVPRAVVVRPINWASWYVRILATGGANEDQSAHARTDHQDPRPCSERRADGRSSLP